MAKEIKVFKHKEKTEVERRADYEKYKKQSDDGWVWDAWLNMIENPNFPKILQSSNIPQIQIKSLLKYAIILSKGNPHILKNDDLWLQYDSDIKVLDLSFKEYRLPRGEKVSPIGMKCWWRKNAGAFAPTSSLFRNTLELTSDQELIDTGMIKLWHPSGILMGTRLTPLPFPSNDKIDINSDFTIYFNEINSANLWYLENESLLYTLNPIILPIPYKFPIVEKTKDKYLKLMQPFINIQILAGHEVSNMAISDLLDIWHQLRLNPKNLNKVLDNLETTWTISEKIRSYKVLNHKIIKIKKDPEVQHLMNRIHMALDTENILDMKRIVLNDKLCQHYTFIVKEMIKNPHKQTILERTTQQFADHIPINYNYYCKLCGELLLTDQLDDYISFNQNIVSATQDKDPIWSYILSECNQVIRHVKFSKPQNIKNLVLAIAQTIESEIVSKQAELQQSKTKSLEDIRGIMLVTISAYCFAFISKMIIDNPNSLRWNVTVGGKVQKQSEAIKVLSIAYNMLIDSNQNRIGKIKDFTIDQLKPLLLKAYEWSRNAKFLNITSEEVSFEMSYSNDPWLDLIYNMAITHNRKGSYKKLIGYDDPADMFQQEKPFSYVFRPKGESPRELAYLELLDYYDSNIYKEYAIPRSPLLSEWMKKWVVDTKNNDILLHYVRPTKRLYNYTGQVPTFQHLDISLIRCPTGEIHNFEPIFKNGKLFDEKCKRCHMSKYSKPNPNVKKSIEKEIDKINFFKYFENLCPVTDDLHNYELDKEGFIGDNPCKKCNYRRSYSTSKQLDYYKKWYNKYPQKKLNISKLDTTKFIWKPKKVDKWNVTLTSVIQIANISKIPYNLWINLGLSENRNFSQLQQNKINPQSTIDETTSVARLIKLVNIVHWVQRQYLLVRNHANIIIPLGLKAILEDETQIMDAHTQLSKLPEILKDFDTNLEYYSTSQSAKINCNYALHTLCNLLLQIRALPLKKIAHKLFDYLVSQIIYGESIMSKLEIQKMQIATLEEDVADDVVDSYLDKQEMTDIMDRELNDPFSNEDNDIENSNTGRDDEEFMD